MFRRYTYGFPTHLIPPGSEIVIYGAADMGRDYGRYVFETGYCDILFYADRDYESIDPIYGYEIVSPERIEDATYDYILIAATNYHDEIRERLVSCGIAGERLISAEIPILNDSPSPAANLYLAYFVSDAGHEENRAKFHPIHRMLLDSLDRYRDADLLDGVSAANKLQADFRACDSLAFAYPYEDERYFYGYLSALMKYGAYRNENIRELPEILHGLSGSKYRKQIRAPFVLSCDSYQKYDRPMFETGPYIRYADSWFSESDAARFREKYGRILLAFPAHESYFHKIRWNANTDADAFPRCLAEQAKRFDSIFVCAYFLNLSEEIIDAYRAIGARIVTCGVRTDQNFVRKNRALLEMADAVAANGFGSSLSFALALDKPILWFEPKFTLNRGVALRNRLPAFEEKRALFESAAKSGEYLSEQAVRYGKDLHGCDKLRSPAEIRAIFEMNELIYKRSRGDVTRFAERTARYLDEPQSGRDPRDALKYRLLAEAWDEMFLDEKTQ